MVVEKEIKYSTYAMLPSFRQFFCTNHCDDCWNFTYCLAISPRYDNTMSQLMMRVHAFDFFPQKEAQSCAKFNDGSHAGFV